ncbi:MAG: LLM class flavin-dependent oxidoreductase [Chloroflexi bacterium]|nr:LLM class flavin-dependent oxidoreductase [Chloroflexota bacterium]
MPKHDLAFYQDVPAQDVIKVANLADDNGFENLWLIDSTDVYPDPWPTAGYLALNTSRVRIGPGVTQPVTRHPRVTANCALTVHDISGGRAILGMGAGANTVRTLGWRPVSVAVMKEAVDICRARFKEKGADIPIYVAAAGDKAMAYACKEADGVIATGANSPTALRGIVQRVRTAAKEVGRDLRTLPVSVSVGFAIAHDRREAMDDMRGPLAVSIKGALGYADKGRKTGLPPRWPPELEHLREEGEKVGRAYDHIHHMKSHTSQAALVTDALVEALGGPVGTPEEVVPKFQALWREEAKIQEEGVDLRLSLNPGGRGKARSFVLFVKEVLPKLR